MPRRPLPRPLLLWVLCCLAGCVGGLAWAQDGDPPAAAEVQADEIPLVVAVSAFPPFVSLEGASPEGFSVDLWRRLADDAGWPYTLRAYPDVVAKLDAVAAGEADVALGGISITLGREQDVDFSHPVFRTGLDILVLDTGGGFGLTALKEAMTPARLGILFGFILLVVVAGHLVWLAERGEDAFDDRYAVGVLEGMYWAIVTASTVGYGDKAPVKWAGRALAAVVIVVSLPMFAIFTAELASTLTVSTLQYDIGGPDDLRSRTVGVVEGTTGATESRARGARVRPFPDVGAAVAALVAGEVEAVVHDAPALAHQASQRADAPLARLGTVFAPQRYGFVVPQGSPRREAIDRALLAAQESGTWEAVRQRWFEGSLGR